MRSLFVLIHRWLGLGLALFLFVSGLSGALIAWHEELDTWLNPELFLRQDASPARPVLALVDEIEARDRRLRVDYTPLALEPGRTLFVRVRPRVDPATNKPFLLDFDQMAIDPGTGALLGTRRWGRLSLARRDLLPFVYELHASLHLPELKGRRLGNLVMGSVALVWTLDSFVALWISFPSRKSWRRSFQFRFRAGRLKALFDLHRSTGVWLWLALLGLAITGMSLTLRRELVEPVVSVFSTLTPSTLDARAPLPSHQPSLTRAQAIELARGLAHERGIVAPAGGIFHAAAEGVYGVGFFLPGHEHGEGGLGSPWLYVDDSSGRALGGELPGVGSAGDVFLQAQFPLHSGRILGTRGRALVSLLGIAVALLSATGVLIWARKRRARQHAKKARAELVARS